MSEVQTTKVPAFPGFEELLLLDLARLAYQGYLDTGEPLAPERHGDLAQKFGVDNIQERIGPNFPPLSPDQQRKVLAHFVADYDTLPTTLPRYEGHSSQDEHPAEHYHDDDAPGGCNKIHGPVTRLIERVQDKILGKTGSPRIRAAILLGSRLTMFCLCPGDDILSLFAQAGAGAPPSNSYSHESLAVLPRRPYEVEEDGTMLPLDQDDTID